MLVNIYAAEALCALDSPKAAAERLVSVVDHSLPQTTSGVQYLYTPHSSASTLRVAISVNIARIHIQQVFIADSEICAIVYNIYYV